MKQLLLLFKRAQLCALLALFCVGGVCAQQQTITVQITVPAGAGPIANAWLLANCPSPLVNNACPVTAQAYIKSVVQQAVQAQLQAMLQWAIATNDASLPAGIKTAIANKQASDTALANTQAAANPTVQ